MAIQLDFTGLNNISFLGAREDFKDALEVEVDGSTAKALKATTEPNKGHTEPAIESLALIKLNREKEDHNRTLGVYKEYQHNIKESETLQTELLKGVKAGEATHTLLLKACKAISLMTGNKVFYNQIEADIKAIYGEGLLEQIPLEWELDEVRERKAKLEEAYKREETSTDAKERIGRAIKAHEERANYLSSLLQGK